jgi:tRNA threonylcarbamoyladenosine biosynthesis protein TsaE
MKQVLTNSAEETERLAESIGCRLKGGEVIELISDLGGGKTTFARGLARGAGSQDKVSSPTFTVSKLYKAPNFDIHHLDFYRLHEAGLMEHELEDFIGDRGAVVIVEWADVVAHVLPDERLTIKLKSPSEQAREIELNFPESLGYLTENL